MDLDFECARPFGAEMLMVVGRTDRFSELETVERDGYYFIASDNPGQVALLTLNTRGFKRQKRDNATIQQTESKLMITTVFF